MKFYIVTIIIFLISSVFVINAQDAGRTFDVVIFSNFEDGEMGEWHSVDGTYPTNWNEVWHLSETEPWGGFGSSWWMGDEGLGGYTSHRYVTMYTPWITLPAGECNMTFLLSYYSEEPGNTIPDYDAYDGGNVAIMVEGSDTWLPISGSPAYDGQSFYGFGNDFNEGPNVPGWGGQSEGWLDAEFDLSEYSGQQVWIRWAFASDTMWDTSNDENAFGMKIDNINIANGLFVSDGEGAPGDTQMEFGYGGVIAGDLWQVTSENQKEGSNYCLHCPVTYYQMNELISRELELPYADVVYLEYWLYASLLDYDGDGNNEIDDLYDVYIKNVDESAWTRLHWLFNGPDGGIEQAQWTLIDRDWVDTYLGWQPNSTADISDWRGQTVEIKFTFDTDGNDDGDPNQESLGLFLDDIAVIGLGSAWPSASKPAAEGVGEGIEVSWYTPLETMEIDYPHGPAMATVAEDEIYGYKIFSDEEKAFLENFTFYFHNTSGQIEGGIIIEVHSLDESGEWTIEGSVYIDALAQYPEPNMVDLSGMNVVFDSEVMIVLRDFINNGEQGIICDNSSQEYNGASFALHNGHFATLPSVVSNATNIIAKAELSIPEQDHPYPVQYEIWRSTTPQFYDEPHLVVDNGDEFYYEIIDNVPSGTGYYYGIKAIYEEGGSDFETVYGTGGTGIHNDQQLGKLGKSHLIGNSPNPFNPVTAITFELSEAQPVELSIYNIKGQLIKQLIKKEFSPGTHTIIWDGTNQAGAPAASGVYFYTLKAGDRSETKRMVLLK